MEDLKEQCHDNKVDVMSMSSSSSSSKDLSKSLPEEAFNNFLQGKRHMLVQDYQFAVQSLTTACELYVNHFGELAIECGEVYLLYGKALVRLAQQQSSVLGGEGEGEGSNEDENSSESGSKENESEKNSDAGEDENNEIEEADNEEKEPSESTDSPQAIVDEASSEAKAKEDDSSKPADDDSSKPAKDDTLKPAEDMKVDVAKDEPAKSKDAVDQVPSADENKNEEQAEENQESEEGDLEVAWNILETAKCIFKRLGTIESELKIAEILQLLAEVSLESDKNIPAINDLKECLEIQKKHLKPDDRLLAETYYQMGLAQTLDKQYYEALDNFRTTKSILELRLENVKKTPVDESAGSFASADKDVEISDLENILLDIQEKIEDTEELIRTARKELEEAFVSGTLVSPIKDKGESSGSAKPVSNITHLVKRKKPDETSTSESEPKRIKLSSVTNGDSKVTSKEPAASIKEKRV